MLALNDEVSIVTTMRGIRGGGRRRRRTVGLGVWMSENKAEMGFRLLH